jgi:hypothetical protein
LKINITVGTTYMICILMSHSSLGPHSISLFEDIKRTLLLELETVDISSASPGLVATASALGHGAQHAPSMRSVQSVNFSSFASCHP